MRPKKASTMTSSTMSRDDDGVTVTSSQDGGAAKTVPPSKFSRRPPNVDPPADNINCLGQGQSQGHCQGQNNGQGHIQGQVEKHQLLSMERSSVDNSCSVQTTSCSEKPQKPVKPKNLLKMMRSCDNTGNGVTSPQSGSTLRSSRSSDVDHSTWPRPYRQNSLQSNVELMTPWTTSSTETVEQSSSIGAQSGLSSVPVETSAVQTCPHSNDKHITSHGTTVSTNLLQSSSGVASLSQSSYSTGRQTSPRSADMQLTDWTTQSTAPTSQKSQSGLSSADDAKLICRHDSPRCRPTDDHIAPCTTLSTSSAVQSPEVDILSHPADIDGQTSCGQSSPRCNGEETQQWTEASTGVQAADGSKSLSCSDPIEPPIIYDLLPDNVHLRQGESLQLVAQFTAFPPPDISWYRANELLAPGLLTSAIISIILLL